MKRATLVLMTAAILLVVTPLAKADTVTPLGNTASGFANGSTQTSSNVLNAQSGQPAPFNTPCGSDALSNCSTSWTFTYTLPGGENVVGATLTLGIFDIDSKATGPQVGSYTVGGVDVTSLLNTVSEGLNGGLGASNSEYDILTITLPSTTFAALQTDSVTVALTLAGPGLSVLGSSADNGASLIFSTLDVQTSGSTSSVPEPASLTLLLAALGAGIVLRAKLGRNLQRC